MSEKIDWTKVIKAIAVLLLGAAVSYFGQPFLHGNKDAINIMVTVFSILAGFLIAVITLVGDPKSLPSGSWQVAEIGSQLTYNRLTRHKWLFKLYLLTLFLIFLSMLLGSKYPKALVVFEYVYLFCAAFAGAFSFTLPSSLVKYQTERIEQEISSRRKAEGIKDEEE